MLFTDNQKKKFYTYINVTFFETLPYFQKQDTIEPSILILNEGSPQNLIKKTVPFLHETDISNLNSPKWKNLEESEHEPTKMQIEEKIGDCKIIRLVELGIRPLGR